MLNVKTKGYTFDDLLLIPKFSNVNSRSDVDLSVDLGKGIKLRSPIVSANMKNVTETRMANAIGNEGGLGLLHRFCTVKEQVDMLKNCDVTVGASVGIQDKDRERVDALINAECKIICVDVAHGHHKNCISMVSNIAKIFDDILIIAGNVATADGARALYDAGAHVIKVGIGGGCFAAGTRILMANGVYKNIEEVKPGNRIINKDGEAKNVKEAFCTGVKKVYKIRNSLFYKPTFVTPDHKYWVGDLNSVSTSTLQSSSYVKLLRKQSKTTPKQSKFKWKELADLNQDYLLIPQNISFELKDDFLINIRKRFAGNKPDNFKYRIDSKLTANYDLGFIFGTFLGDGHAMEAKHNGSNIGASFWYFNKNEKELANKLSVCIASCFGKEIDIKEDGPILKCSFYYKPFTNFLSQFGKKDNKHLPSEYLVSNQGYLKGLLDGLIASDGNVEKSGRIRLSNTSPFLIELFNVLSYLISGVFPNNEKPRWPSSGGLKNVQNKNCKPGLIASILCSGEKRLTGEYQVNKLLDKEVVLLELPVYELTIDCDTHSFIANNAIVHNSLCTTRIETGNGVPNITALEEVFFASLKSTNDIREYYKKTFGMTEHQRDKIGFPKIAPKTERTFKIIADGGIRRAGDVVKSLCFADAVMLGSMLAGTDEAPGNVETVNGVPCKAYEGSSTHKTSHVEGVKAHVPLKGPVAAIIQRLTDGLRSGCSYQGVDNLTDLKKDPKFVEISNAGLAESHPHSVIVKE